MQEYGTLGANRAKDDYLLQPFQNGKLIMINIPLPDDRGKGTCEFLTGSTFLTVFLLLCKLKNKLYIHKAINLWRAPIVNTKSQCVQQRILKELIIIYPLGTEIRGAGGFGGIWGISWFSLWFSEGTEGDQLSRVEFKEGWDYRKLIVQKVRSLESNRALGENR